MPQAVPCGDWYCDRCCRVRGIEVGGTVASEEGTKAVKMVPSPAEVVVSSPRAEAIMAAIKGPKAEFTTVTCNQNLVCHACRLVL